MRKTLTLIIIMMASLAIQAQNGTVRGRITDPNAMVLPGANIFIESLSIGAVSDVNGFYTLMDVPAGTQTITVSYIGFSGTSKQVNIEQDKTNIADFVLEPGIMLGEVVIGTQLQGQAKALNQQKNSPNIINVVSSDQVGRFPDANIGDALKRLPGINVQYDQGEARYGSIRGTEARLNSVMINGERIPSADGDNRVIQLDLVPADMVQTIEVNKALTPDMDADAIGGAVNLITRSIPSGFRVSATAGAGYNFLAQKPILTGALVYSNRYFGDKLGFNFSASIHDHKFGSDNTEFEWEEDDNGNLYTSNFEVRQYALERLRQSYSLSLDYKIDNNHLIYVNGLYNNRKDWENRYRLRYTKLEQTEDGWEAEIRRDNKNRNDESKNGARLEKQQTIQAMLGGDHLFAGKLKMNWSFSYAKAMEEKPHEMSIGYRAKGVAVDADFTDTEAPRITPVESFYADLNNRKDEEGEYYWSLFDLTRNNNYTTDQDYNARLDFQLPLISDGNFKNSLKFGGRLRMKEKVRDNDDFEFEPLEEGSFDDDALANLTDVSKDNFLAGDYATGSFIDPEWAGGLELDNESLFENTDLELDYMPGNYTANENITAGYIMLNQNFGKKLLVIAGVRFENTGIDYKGHEANVDEETVSETEGSDNYLDILPALLAKYDIGEKTVIRAAFTNTLARPNYYDLVPYRSMNKDDGELSEGNPELNPTRSMNLDFMVEHYLKKVGILSGGIFYKNIDDFIFTYEINDFTDPVSGYTFDSYFQPMNGSNAQLMGFEISAQHQFDYLPGFLGGFGIYGNYTFTDSRIEGLPVEGREDEELPMPGTAKNTVNGSLSYEKGKLNLRLSLNYSSSFLETDGVGETAFFDRYYDNVLYLDANGTFAINKNLRIFVEANNLTNQPLRYYQGEKGRVAQAEYYNARLTAGVKLDLSGNK